MKKIIPTVFAKTKKEFGERFKRLTKVSRELQIDFMDGKFVRAKGIKVGDVPNLKGKGKFEAHLMVKSPSRYLLGLKRRGFSKVIFHVECDEDIVQVIDKIRKLKMKAWIALNPSTDIDRIEDILNRVDGVLFMGVNPGKEKQKFVSGVYSKIRKFRKAHKGVKIQVDGGVNLNTIVKLARVGVDIVNSGSFVGASENPRGAFSELRKLV
jgi:ribulose-phosphate 3-epimerase